jgi:hypothetical protein
MAKVVTIPELFQYNSSAFAFLSKAKIELINRSNAILTLELSWILPYWR